jgi:hypothetical protein
LPGGNKRDAAVAVKQLNRLDAAVAVKQLNTSIPDGVCLPAYMLL